jgi:hypothetical protein
MINFAMHFFIFFILVFYYIDLLFNTLKTSFYELFLILRSHIEYPTGTKNSNFVEDHPRNIPTKFGSNRPSGFGEEA